MASNSPEISDIIRRRRRHSTEHDYTILINPAAGAFDDGTAFNQGQEATLDIVSPAGATTQVELRAPDLFSNNGEAVRL
jgi:hypothetical protein